MSRTRGAPRETLKLLGTVADLPAVWHALGFRAASPSPAAKFLSSPSRDQSPLRVPQQQSDDEATSTDESEEQRRLWTQHVLADISCDGKFLILASQKEISILTSKWRGERLVFSKLWNGQLDDTDSEVLTCCIALPLSAKQRSADRLPDWTCVIYGFKSGYVAFHTETGYTVHRQKFDTHPVRLIKVHSPQYTRAGEAQNVQELIILYENGAVVFINGLHLYSCLQSYKLAAATATAKGKGEDDDLETNSIPHEKFQLDTKQDIRDVISLGSVRISLFDQLLNASVLGGSSAAVKSPLPTFRRFVAVGSKPFYASYFIMEGETPLIIGQMAKDIASKMTQAVTSRISATASRFGLQGLLNRAMPSAKEAPEKKSKFIPKPGRDVESRCSLFDARRIATNVVLSDKCRLAALTDNFGRVLLMDCSSGVVIRMWKGYRAAEVAWITVADAKSSVESPKYVECLVIYAPRRHLLEVWSPLSFRRLIAIHVSQGLRLLPVGTGALCPTFEAFHRPSECYFLDLTGNLYVLNVPFYLTEEGIDEGNAQDLQVVQQVKEMALYGKNVSIDKVLGLFGEIQSIEAKDQLVQFLLMEGIGGKEDGVMRVLAAGVEGVSKKNLDEKEKNTVRAWMASLRVLEWYRGMVGEWMEYDDADSTSRDLESDGNEQDTLSASDATTLFALIRSISDSKVWKAGVQHRKWEYDWRTMLNLLDPLPSGGHNKLRFTVNPDASADERLFLADTIFHLFFLQKMSLSDLMERVGILNEDDLNLLLLEYWLVFAGDHFEIDIDALHSLQRLFGKLLHKLQPNELRTFRQIIENSTKLCAAITACLAILSVGFKVLTEEAAEVDDWETVCREKLEWARLSQRLESLLSLQAFACRFACSDTNEKLPDTSVTSFLQHGKSSAAEYSSAAVASGLLDLPPSVILKAFYHADVEMQLPSTEAEESNDRPLRFLRISDVPLEKQEITEALACIKKVFPKSLTADILLANCSWEMVVAWNKRPDDGQMLEKSVEYLKNVVCSELQHGVAVLMWKTFLQERTSSCANLLEKVGKAPKERLFSRDVGMDEAGVDSFLQLTHSVLSIIFQADFDNTTVSVANDDLWLTDNSISAKSSLAELALCQPMSNAALVNHHMILTTVLHATVYFNLKSVKPVSLFDFKAREAFYKELTQFPLLSVVEVDQAIIRARNQFLIRCLSALVRTAADHANRPDVAWLERILEVAQYFGISGDDVRSLYVCELYAHGLDELGEEAYRTVTDKGPLLSKLLSLAGQRLKAILSNTLSQSDYANYLSSMSPFLTTWIKSLEGRTVSESNVDWDRCQLLLRNISHDLRSNHPDHKVCNEALEWMQNHRPQS